MATLRVAVDGFHGESRQAYGDVFGSAFCGSGILDPFAAVGDDRLTRRDIHFAALMLYVQAAFQHEGEFVELRGLSRLFPALRTAHVSDAHPRSLGVDAPDEFVDQFRLAASGADACWLCDQSGHGFSLEMKQQPIYQEKRGVGSEEFRWSM